jgi:hypothetical protein
MSKQFEWPITAEGWLKEQQSAQGDVEVSEKMYQDKKQEWSITDESARSGVAVREAYRTMYKAKDRLKRRQSRALEFLNELDDLARYAMPHLQELHDLVPLPSTKNPFSEHNFLFSFCLVVTSLAGENEIDHWRYEVQLSVDRFKERQQELHIRQEMPEPDSNGEIQKGAKPRYTTRDPHVTKEYQRFRRARNALLRSTEKARVKIGQLRMIPTIPENDATTALAWLVDVEKQHSKYWKEQEKGKSLKEIAEMRFNEWDTIRRNFEW